MTLMIRFLLVLSVFFVVGCATVQVGREFDPTVFQSFEVGKTTTTAVLQAVGEPWLRQTMPDGLEVWTYLSSRSQAFSNCSRSVLWQVWRLRFASVGNSGTSECSAADADETHRVRLGRWAQVPVRG